MAFDASRLLDTALANVRVRVDTAAFSFTLDGLSSGPDAPSQPSRVLTWLRPSVTVTAPNGQQLYRVAPYGDPPPPPDPVGVVLLVAAVGLALVVGGYVLARA